ncbi:MAG: hypothetical protein ACRDIB_05745 [Ardenticatenaceae bacterium]
MKRLHDVFTLGYVIITLLFMIAGFALVYFAVVEMWHSFMPGENVPPYARFGSLLEGIGLLTIAVAAFELGQTILEEEVQRQAQVSNPTRVRRFLSRFLIVVVVSLSIEFLVVTFELIHDDPTALPQASTIGFATAALLAAWGWFIQLNRSAEELEHESIEEVTEEDHKIE